MTATPDFGPIDLSDFTLGAMLRTGIALRRAVRGCATLESAAGTVVRYLHNRCVDPHSGSRTCVLARFYTTLPFEALDPPLKRHVAAATGSEPSPELRCLTLLGSAGDEPVWNSRHQSRAHRAIPLRSAESVRAAPMIARLIEGLGVDLEAVVTGQGAQSYTEARTYDVFHVEQALGSPEIPAQEDFVVPYSVRSVVGFGGSLRSGELFAVVLFSRVPIPEASAKRFRAIALDIRSALFTLGEASIWE